MSGSEDTTQWNLSFDGGNRTDQATGIVVDGISNVTVVGYLTPSNQGTDVWIQQFIGNASSSGSTPDTTAPTVTFIDPPTASVANFSTRPFNFTWNVTDDIAATLNCNLTILNSTGTTSWVIANTAQNTGVLKNVSYLAGSFVNATLNWTVNCSDGTNTGTAGVARTFTVDLSPPIVNLMEPQNYTGYTNPDTNINFSFNVTDAQDSALDCNMTIGNGSDYKLTNFLTSGNGVANVSLYTNNFTNATHNWTVNCTNDVAGVTNSGTRFFTVDQQAPVVTFIDPANATTYTTPATTINFTWNVTDDINTTVACNLSIGNGSDYKIVNVQSTNSTFTTQNFYPSNFTNSVHNWSVNCTDAGGNTGVSSGLRSFTVNVDAVSPTIVLVAPPNTSGYNFSTGEVNFTFNVNDSLDATLSCNLTIGNGTDYKLVNTDANNGTLTNVSFLSSAFTNSTHNWSVNCTDDSGNINNSGRFFFTVDQQAPVVTFVDPANMTTYTVATTTINFTWNVTDDINTTVGCNLTIGNGTNYKLVNVQSTNSTFTTQNFYPSNFTNTTHNWSVNCTDNAQNTGVSGLRLFTVSPDTTPPAIVLVAPPNMSGYNFSTGEVNFTFNVNDSLDATLGCNLTIGNGTDYKLVNTNANNGTLTNVSFLSSAFTNSTHNWSVNCTDDNGNTNTSGNFFFTVDQQAPIIVLIAPGNNSIYNFSTAELNFTFNANDTLDATLACNLTIGNGSDYKLVNTNANNGTLTNVSFLASVFTESAVHNWSVNCTDDTGNINNSGRFFFTLDQTKPAVTTLAPRTATTKGSGTLIELAANVSDLIGVSVVLANLTWPNGTQENRTLLLQSGTNYNISYSVPNLTGTLNLTITANDTSANVNFTESVNITLADQTTPLLSNFSPTNGSAQTRTTTIQLSLNVTDNINISNVSVNITYPNGSILQKSMDNPQASFYNTSLLIQSPDRHNITFVANDTADNRQTAITWFNGTSGETCRTLTASANLTEAITTSGTGTCIIMSTNNTVLDCNGYSITGDGNGVGVRVLNATGVNITHCQIVKFDKAIEFVNATASRCENNQLINSTSKDVVVNQSSQPLVTNTTIAATEVSNATNFEVERSQGKLTFLPTLTTSITNISQIIQFGDGDVFVNSTAVAALNISANISLSNLSRLIGKTIKIEADFEDDGTYVDCPSAICTFIGFDETTGIVQFNVTHFSHYRAVEGGSSDGGSSSVGSRHGKQTSGNTTGVPVVVRGSVLPAIAQDASVSPSFQTPASSLEALPPLDTQQKIKTAVSDGILTSFSENVKPAEIHPSLVLQGTGYAWLVLLLLPLLLVVTSLSVSRPRRVFCDEDTLYQLIRSKKLAQYKKLYITHTIKQKVDPDNHYPNLIPVALTTKDTYLVAHLCAQSSVPRELIEVLFAAQKKKRTELITTTLIPAELQSRFRSLRFVSPATILETAPQSPQPKIKLLDIIEYITTAKQGGMGDQMIVERLVSDGWEANDVRHELERFNNSMNVLVQYITEAHRIGVSDGQINHRLKETGWSSKDITSAFKLVDAEAASNRSAAICTSFVADTITRLVRRGYNIGLVERLVTEIVAARLRDTPPPEPPQQTTPSRSPLPLLPKKQSPIQPSAPHQKSADILVAVKKTIEEKEDDYIARFAEQSFAAASRFSTPEMLRVTFVNDVVRQLAEKGHDATRARRIISSVFESRIGGVESKQKKQVVEQRTPTREEPIKKTNSGFVLRLNRALLDFILAQREKGVQPEKIKEQLKNKYPPLIISFHLTTAEKELKARGTAQRKRQP